jgi:hypothetical protein
MNTQTLYDDWRARTQAQKATVRNVMDANFRRADALGVHTRFGESVSDSDTNLTAETSTFAEEFHRGNDTSKDHHKCKQKEISRLASGPALDPLTNRTLRDEATKYLLLHPDLKGVTINYKCKSLYFHTSINPAKIYNSQNKLRPSGASHEWHVLIVKN